MTPKRWQEIKAICHAALECPVDERAAFVASACGRDHELLHEVETLLAHANAASEFLRVPASAIVANLLRASASPIEVGEPSYPADDPARFVIGEVSTVPPSGFSSKADDLALPGSIGEFKILGRIGGGGTATVYLAYQ